MSEQAKTAEKIEAFASANSGKGFVSFYPEVFGRKEIERRYLIKGGPGTGKSTLMRNISQRAEAEGFAVEYYRCSSDPASLDAVVIEGRIAIIDATSPHCMECELAGARDEIVDLGRFWDPDGLFAIREEIALLGEHKRNDYRGAYKFLEAALALKRYTAELVEPYLNRKKMCGAVQRLLKKIPKGKGYALRIALRDSLGMNGRVALCTYERRANSLYFVSDDFGTGNLFLAMIASGAIENGNEICVSYSPIDAERLDAVFFEESKTAFVLLGKEDIEQNRGIIINMKRFIEREMLLGEEGRRVKREYRAAERLCEGLLTSAEDLLAHAGVCHFELEELYKKRMDFEKLEAFGKDLTEGIINKLKAK